MSNFFDDPFADPPERQEVVASTEPQVVNNVVASHAEDSNPAISTQIDENEFEFTNCVPKIIGTGYSPEFQMLLNRINRQYEYLPCLSYAEVYNELSVLSVKTVPTPTLPIINMELEKAQAAKDRLSEIDTQVTQCLLLKERVVDIITDSWVKFTDEKSADKRKGDSSFRFANYLIDLSKIEALSKSCKMIMLNLCSLQDTLSRKITNIQLQIKLMDIGRTALPDTTFSDNYVGLQKIEDVLKNTANETENVDPSAQLPPMKGDF